MNNQNIEPVLKEISVSRLELDFQNPRLPEHFKETKDNAKLIDFIKKNYELDELAISITENGYFKAEPLIAIPKEDINVVDEFTNYLKNSENNFIVVEGNRRLTTLKLLLQDEFADIQPSKKIEIVPVLIYPNRKSVTNFIGVRHLVGVRKWNVYERARFINQLKKERNLSLENIKKIIGDKKNAIIKTYACYKLIELIENVDESFKTKDAKDNFSFLQLSLGQKSIRSYIGLPDWKNVKDDETFENLIPKEKYGNLIFLFKCLFDNGDQKRFIKESRDITGKLSKIFNDEEATACFKETEKIEEAFELIGGELPSLEKKIRNIKKSLESIPGKLLGLGSNQIKNEIREELSEIMKSIKALTEDILDKLKK